MTAIAAALKVSRPHLATSSKREAKPRFKYLNPQDRELVERIKKEANSRPTYGYRRMTARLNRQPGADVVNHKRVYRGKSLTNRPSPRRVALA